MRVVIQRVSHASVTIGGVCKSAIREGLMILVGIEEADTREDADWLCNAKDRLFKILCICDRAQRRTEDCYEKRTDRSRVPPVCKIIYIRYSCISGKKIEIDRKDRGHHHSKRRVAHIIEHPFLFQ